MNPRVNISLEIHNFNSRDILRRLGVSDQILPNLLQNSPAHQEEDITSVGKSQPT